MTDNSNDEFDKESQPVVVRMARGNEKAFYGGPLDGSFDWTQPDDDEMEYRDGKNKNTIHLYERDVTGKMYYTGVKTNNDHQADGA